MIINIYVYALSAAKYLNTRH